MNTCKTCKHWGGPPPMEDKQAKCLNPKVGAHGEGEDEASDAEGYGGIFTGPDFGCVHHEGGRGQ